MIHTLIDIYLANPLAQSIGIVATIVMTLSGTVKDDKKMLYTLTASFAFWSLHFYLLWFYTAAFLYGFMLIRNYFLFRYPKNKMLFIVSALIPIISLGFTYESHIDIIATLAPLVFIYSVYFLQWIKLRIWMIIISFIWLYYSFVAVSIGGVLTELIYLIGIGIGLIKIYKEKK